MANARDARRRKKANKKKAKDKVRKDKAAVVRGRRKRVASADLGEMSRWPLSTCYIGASWHERGCHVRAVLTRYHEQGRLAAAYFEVDLEAMALNADGRAAMLLPLHTLRASSVSLPWFVRAKASPALVDAQDDQVLASQLVDGVRTVVGLNGALDRLAGGVLGCVLEGCHVGSSSLLRRA